MRGPVCVQEVEEFMQLSEPLFYQHQVDMVFNGHTHAYEFTYPMLNYTGGWGALVGMACLQQTVVLACLVASWWGFHFSV